MTLQNVTEGCAVLRSLLLYNDLENKHDRGSAISHDISDLFYKTAEQNYW